MWRPFSPGLAAALLPFLAFALSACPGTIEDTGKFQGRCREPIDVPSAIFGARCGESLCHDAQNPAADLDLISPNPAQRLVGVRSTQCGQRLRIDPADPEASLLLEKLERDEQECDDRMPMGSNPLSRNLIACVRDWVATVAAQGPSDAAGGDN